MQKQSCRSMDSLIISFQKERKNGSVEVTMTYSESEDGFNDTIELSLQKMRCSMQTMQEHEKLGGNMESLFATINPLTQ